MRILLASDIHNEHHNDLPQFISQLDKTVDVLVLAGDIDSHEMIGETLGAFSEAFKSVVYVPGNHEAFGTTPTKLHEVLLDAEEFNINLHYLHPEDPEVTIDGQHFLGSTLWYPDLPDNFAHKSRMADFRYIEEFEPWVYQQNAKFMENLRELATSDSIIVSHHLPSYDCVTPFWRNSGLNRFFVSECKKEIEEIQPKYWLHGHSHTKSEVLLGETRVALAPRGYPNERSYNDLSLSYDPNFIIEV